MHKFFELLAEALNDAGFDVKIFLAATKDHTNVPWTKESVKEILWRPVQKAMTGKESTTEISKVEPSDIHEVLMHRISEITGIDYIPWPSEESRE